MKDATRKTKDMKKGDDAVYVNGAEAADVLVHEHGEVLRVEETAADACQKRERGLHRVRDPNYFNH